jgi:hypothetical protein
MRDKLFLIVLIILCIAMNAVMDHYGLPYPNDPPAESNL